MESDFRQGRYLLYLDVLGFAEICRTKSPREVYAVINDTIATFHRWERLNGDFKTIYFSDTIIFFQEPRGYGAWAFLDVYAIGGMVLSALLAAGIPARGVISFGEFEVEEDTSGRHNVFFGRALIEAAAAEKTRKWIGISILPSAWKPYEDERPGIIDNFVESKVWLREQTGELLLNPFIKLRGWHGAASMAEITRPFSSWDAPDFSNDILGLKFIRDSAADYARRNDFSSPVAVKYHTTNNFLLSVLGEELYRWGEHASLPKNFYGKDDQEAP
jgi:hypothetical protein